MSTRSMPATVQDCAVQRVAGVKEQGSCKIVRQVLSSVVGGSLTISTLNLMPMCYAEPLKYI